jgi:hypothetical protein
MTQDSAIKSFSEESLNQCGYTRMPPVFRYLPTSIKITKTCTYNGNSNSVDLEIKGTGILEENCHIF